ncbi:MULTISPECIES: effector-associated domain EAD1-containing protein [Cyanophyceae]|uniref:Effector-associated domain EAD1-containing protein n=1 Tax=Leptolyngbya subtilissima DQ-A4 TaxID=2933933 RepID=A0ABV0KAA2_9CYAN|nr:effector-associated domain EAD1-containing protein [Nodosilinea sp. FACHB-141]MBD2115205.1 hypothetical protein [Nodosilinea sp. FACHB-141]
MINWDNEQRQVFRLALQEAYTDYDALDLFVDEAMDVSLAEIAPKEKLDKVAFKLLRWAQEKRRLNELFEKFCQANPQTKDALITRLQPHLLMSRSSNLDEADWTTLFDRFDADDAPYLQIAFRQGFLAAYGHSFEKLRPDRPPLSSLSDLQAVLAKYDSPILAVRFVEGAIAELRRFSENNSRDMSELETWCDRVAARFNVPPPDPPADQPTTRHAYLLVALEEHGPDVNVYPELRITGVEKPIGFGASPTTCSMVVAVDHISTWIHQAEAALEADASDDGEVTLEIFLPCNYLDQDIATSWLAKDKRGEEVALGTHRRFLVRSIERIRDRQIQQTLARRWQQLEACADAQAMCNQLHRQETYLEERGALRALLKDLDALGLKFVGQLPADPVKRANLLYEIIDSAIPIALWSSDVAIGDINTLEAEFDALLTDCRLTNFADMARRWRLRRTQSPAAKPIRLLCDRPDRLPQLPDPRREEDLLVAS